ncbi:DUF1292 domain-containing protein [Acetobacterium bakii]|uniref:Uncharacterized protein n=1 Tax=Acetobacterium bakii TaxID=52689 RepID=A0A0L6U4M1_9FIRM|nr:DUF1292 domain-containing protein [Acetobacterium bakii]KNZ43287.1 hypothetical protein AKG39_02280 [Acetobacterium bakii]
MEEMRETIFLVNDDGIEKEYEVVESFDIEEKSYLLLSENEESDDVFPFFITIDENGEEGLMPVEDEAEFALIAEFYDSLDYDDEEEEDEEGEGETE